jgi:tetratricopeptide (TPR) repeat protein
MIANEHYPSIILKARVLGIENIQELMQTTGQQTSQPHANTIVKMLEDAETARKDFEREGDMKKLEQAIMQFQTASEMITGMDEGLSTILDLLGICLRYRFEQLGNVVDIENSIKRHQEAVDLLPDENTSKPGYLTHLGVSLHVRFIRLGNRVDIDEAIILQQKSIDLISDSDPNKPACLSNLGNSLHARFVELGGNITDLDNAIALCQEAIDLMSDDDPVRARYLINLGMSLGDRFKRLGNLVDIDDAIARQRESVDVISDRDPIKPASLNCLSLSFRARFERVGNLADLDKSISNLQRAVDLVSNSHIDKPHFLNNLGTSLQIRYKRLGNLVDIDNAITRQQEAVNLTPDRHPDKPGRLNNLGNSLSARFDKLKNLIDLDNAIARQKEAVDLAPDSQPGKYVWLENLARHYATRYFHLAQPNDAHMAISCLSTTGVSRVGSPADRFRAVQLWILLASITEHETLLSAYECAIDLMPLVAWLGLPIADRHQHLVEIGGIVRDAAEAAISAGQYDKALEWLEQGRSIVWTQILRLRTPVDELREVNSDLADRLLTVSRLLDRGSGESTSSGQSTRSIEEEGRQYRALTVEWESIIEEIRLIPDFKSFLRPPNVSQLVKSAQDGPVVVLNISQRLKRCDALAIIPGMEDVVHIPLPNITSNKITELEDELKDHLYSNGVRTMRGERAAERLTDEGDNKDCRRVLADLWTELAKPVMNSLAFSVGITRIFPFIFADRFVSSLIQIHYLESGGVPPVRLLFCPSMRLAYTNQGRKMNSFITMSYHHTLLLYPP